MTLPAKPIYMKSSHSIKIYDRITTTPVGQTVTYDTLSEDIGDSVTRYRSALYAALRQAQRENGMVFTCVRGIGIMRLSGDDIVDLAGVETKRIRKRARKSSDKLRVAMDKMEDLRAGARLSAIVTASTLAIIADITTKRTQNQLMVAASGRSSELPIKETLRALGIVQTEEKDT